MLPTLHILQLYGYCRNIDKLLTNLTHLVWPLWQNFPWKMCIILFPKKLSAVETNSN